VQPLLSIDHNKVEDYFMYGDSIARKATSGSQEVMPPKAQTDRSERINANDEDKLVSVSQYAPGDSRARGGAGGGVAEAEECQHTTVRWDDEKISR
jgi:hypothetical protein